MDINREQVLVVDDEEDLRKAIVDILTLDGFEVDQAGSAEEAAEKLSQTAYDVLITDHNLPQKTGVELLEDSLVRYPEIIGIVINGYGKDETTVKAIQFNSPRKDQKLVSINCGAIPENLLESELFGHVKGAFTGAVQTRIGRFEQANGGTIFLDEIGNMPVSLQVKLLRVLQEREFERVGGNTTVKVDVRIIAATSSNLEQMVKDGTFREDLYYRLNVIPIILPPLRERREDIPLLVQRFIEHFCQTHKLDLKTVSPQVLKALMGYDWPGNVRQLENFVERMVALTGHRPAILATDLPGEIQNRESLNFVPLIEIPEEGINFQNVVTDMERELILQSLRKTNGNKKLAAKLLNLKRTTLIEKIKRIGLAEHMAAHA